MRSDGPSWSWCCSGPWALTGYRASGVVTSSQWVDLAGDHACPDLWRGRSALLDRASICKLAELDQPDTHRRSAQRDRVILPRSTARPCSRVDLDEPSNTLKAAAAPELRLATAVRPEQLDRVPVAKRCTGIHSNERDVAPLGH